ncbi:MAG: 4Fe-4S binding protein [Dehalococcoidales bacterium]|nr:4Fe-4S binding protein [Dehalococcoidales bacterium]
MLKFKRYGLGIIKGMTVTLRQLLRHPTVVQYPEQRLNTSRRIRGNELIWSRQRCTGCATCAKACPQGAIEIVTATDMKDNKFAVEKYRVDTGYCIQCGLCVEACPYDAVFLGSSYERAQYRRGDVVQTDDALLESADRPASGYFHPRLAQKMPEQTLLIDKINEKR